MIAIRRAGDRFVTRAEGRTTYHSFSYGAHYDPGNIAFGPLIALNEELLPPGTGYDEHRHAATTIVSWVLAGRLHHRDSLGHEEVLDAGDLAVAETGGGITHAEWANPDHGVRFLQFMLRQDGEETSWSRREGGVDLPGASLVVGTREPGPFGLPDAPLVHVFVVDGHVVVGDRELGPGDEARLADEPGRTASVEEASVLAVWAFSAR